MTNDFSKKMVDINVPKLFMDLNPIIAGGFALSLFMTETLFKDSPIMKKISDDNLSTIWDYGDIDLFFQGDDLEKRDGMFRIFEYMFESLDVTKVVDKSIIDITGIIENTNTTHNQDEYKKLDILKSICLESKLPLVIVDKTSSSYKMIGKAINSVMSQSYHFNIDDLKELKEIYGENFSILFMDRHCILSEDNNTISLLYPSKKSKWANSFDFSSRSYSEKDREGKPLVQRQKIQVIKKATDSTQSLLNSFDLSLCSIAWYNGCFEFGDKFMEQLQTNYLQFNNIEKIRSLTFGSRLFQYLRIMKYCKKTKMKPSKEMYDYMISVVIDALYVLKTIEDNQKNDSKQQSAQFVSGVAASLLGTPNPTAVLINSPFGANGLTVAQTASINPYIKRKSNELKDKSNKIKVKLLSSLKDYDEYIVSDSPSLLGMLNNCIGSLYQLRDMEHRDDYHKISLFPYIDNHNVKYFVK